MNRQAPPSAEYKTMGGNWLKVRNGIMYISYAHRSRVKWYIYYMSYHALQEYIERGEVIKLNRPCNIPAMSL